MRAINRAIGVLGLALVAAHSAGATVIAGFGDSLTQGPDYLDYLPAAWETLDLGVPGEESWDGIERLRALLPTLDADVVVILEGTNDVRHPAYSDARSLDSLTGMVEAVLDAGMPAVLAAPPPLFHAGADAFNARLAFLAGELGAFAAARGVPFVDLYDAFLGLADPAAYFQPDGVHPGPLGRQFIAARIEPAVLQAVPEPSAVLLLAAGLGLLALARR